MKKLDTQHKNHQSESAGKLMTTRVPTADENMTVSEVKKILDKEMSNLDTINYIYIIDKHRKLKGVMSIKEIFRENGARKIKKFLPKKIIVAHSHTHQERVAHLALKYNLKAIPVVTKDGIFLGAVPSDIILDIVYHETTEDMLRLSGVIHAESYDNIFKLPITTSLRHRIPWLVIGLLGGMAAAGIIGRFEEVLSVNIILAAFIPLIVYMADAVGAQMEAFIIRDLAADPKLNFLKYINRQASIVIIIGLCVSILLYLTVSLIYGLPQIGFVLGIALFFAILTSLLTSLIIPFLFNKLHFDPANASGPIATIIQDILSVLVYFLVASAIL